MIAINKTKRIVLLALVIIYMVIIFAFSAQTGEESGDFSKGITIKLCYWFVSDFEHMSLEQQEHMVVNLHGTLRTLAHGTEFAGLAVVVFCLLKTYSRIWVLPIKNLTAVALATLLSSMYAVTDEIHQIFVVGRACEVFDWSVDTIGAALGATMTMLLYMCLTKWRKRNGLS